MRRSWGSHPLVGEGKPVRLRFLLASPARGPGSGTTAEQQGSLTAGQQHVPPELAVEQQRHADLFIAHGVREPYFYLEKAVRSYTYYCSSITAV